MTSTVITTQSPSTGSAPSSASSSSSSSNSSGSLILFTTSSSSHSSKKKDGEESPLKIAQQAILTLGDILTEYASWNDSLSQKIFDWGANFIAEIDLLDEEIEKKAAAAIHKLANEILVNSLDGSPLKSPMLVAVRDIDEILKPIIVDCVVEKSFLDRYLPSSNGSYISLQNFKPIDAQAHSFATDILSWVTSVTPILDPFSSSEPTSGDSSSCALSLYQRANDSKDGKDNATLVSASYKDSQGLLISMMFCKLLHDRVEIYHAKKLRTKVENFTEVLKDHQAKLDESLKLEVQRSKAKVQEHETKINAQIERIEKTMKLKVDLLSSRLESSEAALKKEQQKAEQLGVQTEKQEKEIQSLRNTIAQQRTQVCWMTQVVYKKKRKKFF